MGGKEARERRRQKRTAISQPTSVISGEFELSNRFYNIGKIILNDRENSIQKKNNKKIEKPKHLKRKLEQLSKLEEKETREAMRENLLKKQEALERQKAKRSLAFQTKIKEAVGVAFFNKVLVVVCVYLKQNTVLFESVKTEIYLRFFFAHTGSF